MKKGEGVVDRERRKNFRKHFFWLAVVVLVVLSYLILKPYFIALISAFILAHLVKPLHNFLSKRVGKNIAAVISVFVVMTVLILPFAFLVGGVVQQAANYLSANELEGLLEKASLSSLFQGINLDLLDLSERGVSFIAGLLTSAASLVPSVVISIFITLFGIYYILVDWEDISSGLKKYIPFENGDEISKNISQVTNYLVYGTLFIAVLEFFVAVVGFVVSGVGLYLLLSAVVFFFAFLPGVGPAVVWIPLAIYYLVIGNYFAFVGVVVTGLVLSVGIDIFLRAKILGKKAKLNPLLMIVGILGGISVFGVFGFIIGPLVLVYTIELLETGLKNR